MHLLCKQHRNFIIHRSWKLKDPFQGSKARTHDGITARMDSLKLINIELLVNEADLEINALRRRQIYPDLVNIEPQEEPANLDAFQVGDGTIAELACDGGIVVNQVIKLNIAGLLQMHDERTIGRE